MNYIKKSIEEHFRLKENILKEKESIKRIGKLIVNSLNKGNKILFAGNGGSAADAQHLAAEFVGRFYKERVPLAVIALTTDTSIITAVGNDYGYEEIFTRQLNAIGKSGDILFMISTSGNSKNLINLIPIANQLKVTTIGLLGKNGGELGKLVDIPIIIPSNTTARIQEMHILIGHIICGLVDNEY